MGPLRKVQVIGSWRSKGKSKDKDSQTIIIWLCVWCQLTQQEGSEGSGGGGGGMEEYLCMCT